MCPSGNKMKFKNPFYGASLAAIGTIALGVVSIIQNNRATQLNLKLIEEQHRAQLPVFSVLNTTDLGFAPEENVIKRYNKIDDDGRRYRHIDLRKTGDSDKRSDRPRSLSRPDAKTERIHRHNGG